MHIYKTYIYTHKIKNDNLLCNFKGVHEFFHFSLEKERPIVNLL